MTNEELARLFHDTYERLAPSFGYETRKDTRAFDPTTPNGRLMTEVCGIVADMIRPEERKAALTEAASACIDERCVNVKDDIEELAYNEACADCEAAVLRLRDREPR